MLQTRGAVNTNIIDLDIFGRPFASLRGSQDDDEGGENNSTGAQGTDDDAGNSDDDTPDKDGLTAGGRRLIEAEREAAKTAKRALSPWRKLERDFQKSPDEIRAILEGRDSQSTDADAIRREAESAAAQKVNARLVRAEVKALASATFADPSDAHLYIDVEDIDVNDDGEVDTKAIEDALKDVLRRKPHLAKAKADDERDVDNFDGGARRTPPRERNMTDFIREQVHAKQGRGRPARR